MDKHREKIFSPRFVGERFQGHALPLEFLDDLQVLGRINTAIAKWLWKEQHPGRQRVPRGFERGISYAVTAIEDGSAMPNVELFAPTNGLFPAEYADYFQRAPAKLLEAIQTLDDGGDPSTVLPEDILMLLEPFGASLHPDEFVEFRPKQTKAARYTVQKRKKLLVDLSKEKDYTKDADLLGELIDLNKEARTFQLRTAQRRVGGTFTDAHYADLLEAFNEEPVGKKKPVLVAGLIRFNASDSPRAVEQLREVTVLEPLDIQWQLEGLKALPDGWFDGQGSTYQPEAMDKLGQALEAFYTLGKLPSIYPNPEGLVNIEWDNAAFDITLEVDPNTLKGEYHALDLATKRSETKTLSLGEGADQKWLVGALNKAGIQ